MVKIVSTNEDLAGESKIEARRALLEMAKSYEKSVTTIQHAIEAYKEVIVSAPDLEEADEARKGLLGIAQRFEKEGRKESAFHIYRKLARELHRPAPSHPVKY